MYVQSQKLLFVNREPPCGSDCLMQDEIINSEKGDLTKNDVIFLKERNITQDSVLRSQGLLRVKSFSKNTWNNLESHIRYFVYFLSRKSLKCLVLMDSYCFYRLLQYVFSFTFTLYKGPIYIAINIKTRITSTSRWISWLKNVWIVENK